MREREIWHWLVLCSFYNILGVILIWSFIHPCYFHTFSLLLSPRSDFLSSNIIIEGKTCFFGCCQNVNGDFVYLSQEMLCTCNKLRICFIQWFVIYRVKILLSLISSLLCCVYNLMLSDFSKCRDIFLCECTIFFKGNKCTIVIM